ncbi:MAG: hypothetical protein ACK4UN_18640, partial [Limisphaerales bacterium]
MSRALVLWIFLFAVAFRLPATPLPEFAYRQVTLSVLDSNGKPVPSAAIYGFAPDLNLLWPRTDRYEQSDIMWQEKMVGRTGVDGTVQASLPPGNWGFVAVATLPKGEALIVSTDFKIRSKGEKISLKAIVSKQWTLTSHDGDTLVPNRIFVRSKDYPIWLPIDLRPESGLVRLEISGGSFELWGAGEGGPTQTAFIMSWDAVSHITPSGRLKVAAPPAVVESSGGSAVLSWFYSGSFGLSGRASLTKTGKIHFSPGDYVLSWRRPVAGRYEGDFTGQQYRLESGSTLALNFESPLQVGLDQGLTEPDKNNHQR